MDNSKCKFWKVGHRVMNCKYCEIPNQEYCRKRFSKVVNGIDDCPRCGKMIKYPALSRLDNSTKICSKCGNWEAMIDAMFLCGVYSIDSIHDKLNLLEMARNDFEINKHEYEYFGRIESMLNEKLKQF